MIRKYESKDIDSILNIWLSGSIKFHDFVETSFWEAHVDKMRDIYLPASEVYVHEKNSEVVGFYALHANMLAAIFVASEFQGQGIGKALIEHAKGQRNDLTLTVYKENKPSCRFYLQQGFSVVREQIDHYTGHTELFMSSSISKK